MSNGSLLIATMLLATGALVAGCYRCEHSTELDASVGEPEALERSGLLDWAVSLGEYSTTRPLILETHDDGRISVFVELGAKDGENPMNWESIGTYIMIFDDDGTFLEKKLVDELGFKTWHVASDSNGYYLAGFNCSPCHGYIARIDKEGNLLWKLESLGDADSVISNIGLNSEGNLVAMGQFSSFIGSASFSLGNFEAFHLEPNVTVATFYAQVSPNGDVLLLKRLASGMSAGMRHLALSQDDTFYATGTIVPSDDLLQQTVTFGEDENSISFTSPNWNAFLAKFSMSAEAIWVMPIEYSTEIDLPDLSALPNGHLRVAGAACPVQEITFSHPDHPPKTFSSTGIYLADVSPDGEVELLDSPQGDHNAILRDLETTKDGSTIITGTYLGDPIFDPNLNAWSTNPATGDWQCDEKDMFHTFTAMYDQLGDFAWVSVGEAILHPAATYSVSETSDGSIVTSGSWGLMGWGYGYKGDGDSGKPITFAPGTEQETTLLHEDLRYTGFLTKNFR